jgi:hypothetical protein
MHITNKYVRLLDIQVFKHKIIMQKSQKYRIYQITNYNDVDCKLQYPLYYFILGFISVNRVFNLGVFYSSLGFRILFKFWIICKFELEDYSTPTAKGVL